MQVRIKNTALQIKHDDLLNVVCDVIVDPVTPDLWMKKGLSAEILARGGEQIAKEAAACHFIDFGEICKTSAGLLPFKAIYHASVIPHDAQVNRGAISKAVSNCLINAEKDKYLSIAIPMLSSAMAKVPYDTYAGIMLTTAIEYLMHTDSKINHVIFCSYNPDSYNSFVAQLKVLRQEYLI
jgi:O-acetyl-ADP-ribose deacetylase (regulator of RNase III)